MSPDRRYLSKHLTRTLHDFERGADIALVADRLVTIALQCRMIAQETRASRAADLRAAGSTWKAVGTALGVTAERARQLAHQSDRSARTRTRVSSVTLDSPIEKLRLGNCAYGCLRDVGIETVRQLVALDDDTFHRLRPLGPATVACIDRGLARAGLARRAAKRR